MLVRYPARTAVTIGFRAGLSAKMAHAQTAGEPVGGAVSAHKTVLGLSSSPKPCQKPVGVCAGYMC